MNRRMLLALLPLAAISLLLIAEPALAQTSDVGKNIGREIKTWATALLLGVAGLVAIPVLAKRDVNGGLVLAMLVVIVGGFVFAQPAVKGVITGLWQSIGG